MQKKNIQTKQIYNPKNTKFWSAYRISLDATTIVEIFKTVFPIELIIFIQNHNSASS